MSIIKKGMVTDEIKGNYRTAKMKTDKAKDKYLEVLLDMPQYVHEDYIGQEDESQLLMLVKAHTDFKIACFELMEAEEDYEGYMPKDELSSSEGE